MRLLLDTHAFPWRLAGDERLSEAARDGIANAGYGDPARRLAQNVSRETMCFPALYFNELAENYAAGFVGHRPCFLAPPA